MAANAISPFSKTITIDASAGAVWNLLTEVEKMKKWMAEPEMDLDIKTTWEAGTPIVVKGFHHVKFENRGTVLAAEPNKLLSYNYLSSISRLPNTAENYTQVEFRLSPIGNNTSLTITVSNCPTEAILKHVEFYWAGTIEIIKQMAEER